jgi:hypothetical protein
MFAFKPLTDNQICAAHATPGYHNLTPRLFHRGYFFMKKEIIAPEVPASRLWRNRIVHHAEVDPRTLKANPRNWRSHPRAQQEAIAGVLREVGWVQDVIVNKRTGFVVDGHARIEMAIAAGELVPVKYVDLTEKEEELVLASFDPLTSMAMVDEAALAPLLAEVNSESAALDALLKSMLDQATITQIHDADENASVPDEKGAGRGLTHDGGHAVKAVFAVNDLRTVERAIRLAGVGNRGNALVAICEAYIQAEVQADALAGGGLEG